MTNFFINKFNSYSPPNFTPDQQKILLKYFTNVDKPVYAFTSNVPTEVAGALISRFSRTNKSPRELFLEEFLKNPDLSLSTEITNISVADDAAKERAGKFFQQVLAKYGDESVAEITGVHLVIEKASLIAIKIIESMRRMAFIEQSTRYIDLSGKVDGKYEYYRDEKLISLLGTKYEEYADNLYEHFQLWFNDVKDHVKAQNPMLETDTEIGYNQSIHSRTCDILRELLPLSLRSTVGIFGYGRDWSDLVSIMLAHDFEEVREIGKMILTEVSQMIPNIMDRVSGPHGKSNQEYLTKIDFKIQLTVNKHPSLLQNLSEFNQNTIEARILEISNFPLENIAAGMIYSHSAKEFNTLLEYFKINPAITIDLINQIQESRQNRFNKVPDGFEKVRMSVEFTAPWSCWKDIQRHRRLTEIHNNYFVNTNFYIAPELFDLGLDKKYSKLMTETLNFIKTTKQNHPEIESLIEYLVPHGAEFRWIMDMDLAEAIYMMELRSIPGGHMVYRKLMHAFYYELKKQNPALSSLVKFIDLENYYLGRRQSYNKVVAKGASLE